MIEDTPEDARHRPDAERIAATRFPLDGPGLDPRVQMQIRAGYAQALIYGWRDAEYLARQREMRGARG